jgi:hypothetical protein
MNSQPHKIRICLDCVSTQRGFGKTVGQASNVCNQFCKRNLFETENNQDKRNNKDYLYAKK